MSHHNGHSTKLVHFNHFSDPSIEGDTPFKPTKSLNEIFCQNVSNELKTSVITDIAKQRHYDAWREIEKIYNDFIGEKLDEADNAQQNNRDRPIY